MVSISAVKGGPPRLIPAKPPLNNDEKEIVQELVASSGRRINIPVRHSFVRSATGETPPPLAKLIASRGAVALKLYLALIWRCSKEPYRAQYPARTWAKLLGLDDPAKSGARRIRDALENLQSHKLVRLEKHRGDPTMVYLLQEDGSGREYNVPHASFQAAKNKDAAAEHEYFQIPQTLWVSGHLQRMSTPALAMLLVVMEESRGKNTPQWWSVDVFNKRFALKKDTRSTGAAELEKTHLLKVESKDLPPSPGVRVHFTRKRTRRSYQLLDPALPLTETKKKPKTRP